MLQRIVYNDSIHCLLTLYDRDQSGSQSRYKRESYCCNNVITLLVSIYSQQTYFKGEQILYFCSKSWRSIHFLGALERQLEIRFLSDIYIYIGRFRNCFKYISSAVTKPKVFGIHTSTPNALDDDEISDRLVLGLLTSSRKMRSF